MDGQWLDAVPITMLKGVGPTLSRRLARIGLHSVRDLLLHLPLRYEDRTRIVNINQLIVGQSATVVGHIIRNETRFSRRRSLICQVSDGTGVLTLRFFNFTSAMQASLATGNPIRVYGEIKKSAMGMEIIHPDYQLQSVEAQAPQVAEALTPVYSTTEGLRQATLRNLMQQALTLLQQRQITELLPDEFCQPGLSLPEAIITLHCPPANTSLQDLLNGTHPAQQRLILEELLAHNLSMLRARQEAHSWRAVALPAAESLINRLLANLPFKPTAAQLRVAAEIERDMRQTHPMMRLLQGDVGSGKTLVAALAALQAIAAGYQVALMAPTELLAEQHVANFSHWLMPLEIGVGCLLGKKKGKARQEQQEAIASGSVAMVIGTHALFQQDVTFNKLALVIIDEQHRFGVHQRLLLWEKGQQWGVHPHQLIMTATPIPRTLAMTAYADLDTSIIDELPAGRTPVTTVAIADSRREEVIERVRLACINEKRQAYWVCTLIDESGLLEAQAAEVTATELQTQLPQLRIALIHGRIKAQEKQQIMTEFKTGSIDLLVATTVIEVGVDVSNASLMIIENPERLGLAQIHQLRGRVGRGAVASHCVLLYKTPLSKTAWSRLQVLRDSHDGFVIAQKDLELRGPGEVLGTKQTGLAEFRVADLLRDQHMIPRIQQIARQMQRYYPEHSAALIQRWLAENSRYTHA